LSFRPKGEILPSHYEVAPGISAAGKISRFARNDKIDSLGKLFEFAALKFLFSFEVQAARSAHPKNLRSFRAFCEKTAVLHYGDAAAARSESSV